MKGQITEHFFKSEFESKDGSEMPDWVYKNIVELAFSLQELRDYLQHPIIITSGYRDPYYNDVILPSMGYETSNNSQHKLGKAADIVVRDMKPNKVAKAIMRLRKDGCMRKGGLGIYNGFVHYDIRGKNINWDKSSRFNFLPF